MIDPFAAKKVLLEPEIKMMETMAREETTESPANAKLADSPIFILGIMPRSGTHFLANLLCLHPDCTKSALPEDRLVGESGLLRRYTNSLRQQWSEQSDEIDPALSDLLFESLGEGLLAFLRRARTQAIENRVTRFGNAGLPDHSHRRIVTKTPTVKGLEHFFHLFPQAQVLILVRDGRAVVESNAASFRSDREQLVRAWAAAARKIVEFDHNPANDKRGYLIVRYEDLVIDPASEMRRILGHLRLDPRRYDFQATDKVPVVGSSTFKRGAGPVHWLPVSKTADFNPLARADHWNRRAHERFNWLAAEYLKAFGYEPKIDSSNHLLWLIWNRTMDAWWSAKARLQRLKTVLYSGIQSLKVTL